MSKLSVVTKLTQLLTKQNIKYLDKVLDMVTDRSTHTFAIFWGEVNEKHKDFDENAKRITYKALLELRSILHDYGSSMK